MPRKSKKVADPVKTTNTSILGPNDDEQVLETGTVASSTSETHTVVLEDGSEGGEDKTTDATLSIDHLQDKLKDAIENATDSSAKSRETALTEINMGLERRLLSEFVADRQATLADIVERSLRRGKSVEQVLAGRLASLLCLQLGEDCGEVYQTLRPALLATFSDASVSPAARIACARSLGIGSFIALDEPEIFTDVIHKLSKTFAVSYLKGDRTSPLHSLEVLQLHCQCLLSWSLLMSVASDGVVADELALHYRKLPDLLECSDVELRIAAGETLALMNELVRTPFRLDRSLLPDVDSLCVRLRELATESAKYRAKKDKKQQKSSFREVLHSIEDGDGAYQRIRFGKEVLDLHTWRNKIQYDALCNILRTGMNHHLRMNPLIREIFELGESLPEDALIGSAGKKGDKIQKQQLYKAKEKIQDIDRNTRRGNKLAGKTHSDDDD